MPPPDNGLPKPAGHHGADNEEPAMIIAIAAYDQDAMDRLLGVDGQDEFVVYLAPVGKE